MSTFGLLGFIFGCFAVTYAASIEGKCKKLEQRVQKLEEKEE